MPGASGTPALLGRERERAQLYDALTLALKGDPQTVLVSGDAGIGKTTLVADLVRRAEHLGFSVALGHCLDIETDVSFAPVVEAVSALVAAVEDAESRPLARRMRALLEPGTPRGAEQIQLLDVLRRTLLEAAASGPVLLVIEDLHWADTSTRDLVVALSRTARGRLLLVLTVRTDDLHRRHPARKALAEIGRGPGGKRVDLDPLDRDSIAVIVEAHSQGAPDPAVVRSVVAQSEGNPLYAEEIVAAGPGTVPEQLSDLFLTRIDALGEGPRALARMASVGGTQLDLETLRELVGVDPDQVNALLRELLDANVLRSAGDALAFWHPLLREAVYDDLVPDERLRLHAEVAAILQKRVDADPDPRLATLSRLAFHWSAAQDLPQALVASVRAGTVATGLGAAEGVTHLERALSIWDRVPNSESVAGLHQIELILRLGESLGFQAAYRRRYGLVRRAVDMLRPDTDPLLVSRTYSALAYCALFCTDPIGSGEASRLALEYAGESASDERVRALLVSAKHHVLSGHSAAALEALGQAVQVAEVVGCPDISGEADAWRSLALYLLGRVSEAKRMIEQGLARSRNAGPSGDLFEWMEWLAKHLTETGQVDRGLLLASNGLEEGLALGFSQQAGGCGEASIYPLTWLGRLDEAERRLEVLRDLELDGVWAYAATCEVLLARGDIEAAAPLVESARWQLGLDTLPDEMFVVRQVRLAELLDDPPTALEAAMSYLARLESCDSPLVAGAAARIGFQALALNGSAQGTQVDEIRALATGQLGRARAGLTDEWRGGYHGVQLALAEAYAARVAGGSAVDEFRVAAALAEPFGAFFALEPRVDLAEELLAHGGRDEGRELLVDCWTAAHDMGARGLEQRASKLATRTRVPLPRSATSEGPLSRLTPREREVLDLLATGATNKTIAGTLFISEKTASVHVSNLLGKLHVENRGAAAALARRLVG